MVVLNGAPRSGKSSIARAVQAHVPGCWVNLGVDVLAGAIPEQLLPGIGLRPGGECPDLEPVVAKLYEALWGSVASHSRAGVDVVVDVGLHDDYSAPLGVLSTAAQRLAGVDALFVGVRCPIEVIMARRDAGDPTRPDTYTTTSPDGAVPSPVIRWQEAVHRPGIYDLEVDSSVMTAEECARAIGREVESGRKPAAFLRVLERES